MNDEITFKLVDDDVVWNEALSDIPSSNLFHTAQWLNFIKKQFSLRLSRYHIMKAGRTVGILPLFAKGRFLMRIAGSPLILENNLYMGLALADDSDIRETLPVIDKFLKRRGFSFMRFSFDHFNFAEEFKANNYEIRERKTCCVDLRRGMEVVWKNMESNCRNMVRKAEKNDCRITEAFDLSFIEPYYRMIEEVYARQDLPPLLSKRYYENIFNALHPHGFLKVFMAYSKDGQPLAGAIVLMFKKKAYYLDGASFREFNKIAPSNLLQWHIMCRLIENGYEVYDMVCSDIPRWAAYKMSFGAVNEQILYAERSYSAIAKIAKLAYAKGKHLNKRVRFRINKKA